MLLALLAASATAEVVWPTLIEPPPIDSDDLKRLVKDAGFTPDQRMAVEAAFDVHVERWQHLRDAVIRPFDRRMSDMMLEVERRVWLQDHGVHEPADHEAAAGDGDQHDSAQPEEEDGGDPRIMRRARALEPSRRRIFHRIEALEQEFITSLQAIAQDRAQLDSIDLFAQGRRITWSDAVLKSTGALDFRGLDELPELPVTVRDAEVRARASARILQLGRDHADMVHRAAERALVGNAGGSGALIDALIRLRLSAVDEVTAMLPADLQEPWWRSNRDELLARHLDLPYTLSQAALSAVLGEHLSPAIADRLERWHADRRLFEDRLLLPKTPEEVPVYPMAQRQLDEIEEQAVADIAKISGVPDLAAKLQDWSMSQPETEPSDDAVMGASEPGDPLVADTSSTKLETADPMVAEFSEHIGDSSEWPMLLPRLRKIHDALEVSEADEALWNMLVEDFRDRGLRILRSMPEPSPRFLVHEPETMAQLRASVQRLESEFFDTLAAALPDLAPASVERERTRRTHERLAARAGRSVLGHGYLSGSLSIIDPFDAMDGLSLEVRAMIDDPITRWLTRRDAALREMCDLDDTYRRSDAMPRTDYRQWEEHFQTMNRLSADSARHMRRSEEAAERELREILATMPMDDARRLDRSIRLLREPDIYRPLHAFEELLDRACSIDGLGPEQRERLQALRTDHRDGTEPFADRIMALVRSIRDHELQDRIEEDVNANKAPELRVDAEIGARQRQELDSARVSDLTWDLQELNARARRRLAAVVDFTTLEARDKP